MVSHSPCCSLSCLRWACVSREAAWAVAVTLGGGGAQTHLLCRSCCVLSYCPAVSPHNMVVCLQEPLICLSAYRSAAKWPSQTSQSGTRTQPSLPHAYSARATHQNAHAWPNHLPSGLKATEQVLEFKPVTPDFHSAAETALLVRWSRPRPIYLVK